MAKRPAKRPRGEAARRGKALATKPPDLLGPENRARMVADQILQLQQQRFALSLSQTVNDSGDDDRYPIQGVEPERWPTYAQRRDQIDAAIERLWTSNDGLSAQIEEALKAAAGQGNGQGGPPGGG